MEEPQDKHPSSCGAKCPECSGHDHAMPAPPAGAMEGWRLALAAMGAFLMPLGLAVLGAVLANDGANRQFAGALIGLATGGLIAGITARLLAKKNKRSPEG